MPKNAKQKLTTSRSTQSSSTLGNMRSATAVTNQDKQKVSVAVLLVWLLNIVIAVGITSYVNALIVKKQYTPIILSKFTANNPSSTLADSTDSTGHTFTSLEHIHNSIQLFAVLCLVVLIIGELLISAIVIKNDVYRSVINIGNNTFVSTAIFVGLVANCYGQLVARSLFVPILDIYLLGRLLFAIGYFLGTSVGLQSFRAVGFGFTVAATVNLICINFGVDMLEAFKNIPT